MGKLYEKLKTHTTTLRTIGLTLLSFCIVAVFAWSKLKIFFFPTPPSAVDYSQYPLYSVPVRYIIDYFQHAWVSLAFAFFLSGAIQEFISKETVQKYLGSGKFRDYFLAAGLSPLFTTCSCSVVPIYIALLVSGASLGVVMTFFLMAPAANLITILLTGDYLGWDLGIWRLGFSLIAAVSAGYLFDQTEVSNRLGQRYKDIDAGQAKKELAEPSYSERIENVYRNAYHLTKQIIPYLLVGLFFVSFLAAYLPQSYVVEFFTGFKGIIVAALLGGPLYTPTLVEIALTQMLLTKGMDRATALSFVMGQPYDVVSMAPNSKYFTWKGISLYTIIFFSYSVLSGILYAIIYGVHL